MGRNDFIYKYSAFNEFYTCSLVVNGTVILFGGEEHLRSQISVVTPFGVKLINTLPFDFTDGKCHFNNGTIYLCFDYFEPSLCRKR